MSISRRSPGLMTGLMTGMVIGTFWIAAASAGTDSQPGVSPPDLSDSNSNEKHAVERSLDSYPSPALARPGQLHRSVRASDVLGPSGRKAPDVLAENEASDSRAPTEVSSKAPAEAGSRQPAEATNALVASEAADSLAQEGETRLEPQPEGKAAPSSEATSEGPALSSEASAVEDDSLASDVALPVEDVAPADESLSVDAVAPAEDSLAEDEVGPADSVTGENVVSATNESLEGEEVGPPDSLAGEDTAPTDDSLAGEETNPYELFGSEETAPSDGSLVDEEAGAGEEGLSNEAGLAPNAEESAPESPEQTAEQGLEPEGSGEPMSDEEARQALQQMQAQLAELEADKKKNEERAFVKGWLTSVGSVDFVSDRHRFVVGFQMFPVESSDGGTLTHRTYYLGAVPRVSLHFNKLFLSFEIPVAFELFDIQLDSSDPSYVGGDGISHIGSFAGVQWDKIQEYSQVIRYIQYGSKEDDLYLNVSKFAAASIGHGAIVRRYNPNIDLDHFHVSAQLDKSFHIGGFEVYSNDIITFETGGFLAYAKPGKFIMPDNLFVRSTSLGFSYLFDRNAPASLEHDSTNGQYLVADDSGRPALSESVTAKVLGIDTEVKLVKLENLLDVKSYVDYSRLLNTGGSGFTLGGLARLNLGGTAADQRLHALRVRAEAGLYSPTYAPGYFDTFYEIQKYQAEFLPDGTASVPKLQWLAEQEGSYRLGGRVEATYSLVNGVGLTAAYQGSSGGRDSEVLLHLEVPTGDHLRLLATYARTNLGAGGSWFSLQDPNTLLIGRARMKLLPILFLNAEVSQMYRLRGVTTPDDAEGAELVAGDPAQFKNVLRWVLEAELGFEF